MELRSSFYGDASYYGRPGERIIKNYHTKMFVNMSPVSLVSGQYVYIA